VAGIKTSLKHWDWLPGISSGRLQPAAVPSEYQEWAFGKSIGRLPELPPGSEKFGLCFWKKYWRLGGLLDFHRAAKVSRRAFGKKYKPSVQQ